MTNLVAITVKATDSSNYAAIKAEAAKAGDDAAKAFNAAFKLRADMSGTARERVEESGGLGGRDDSLMNKLKSYANTPGGIGILGTGNDTSLVSMLKNQIRSMGEQGGPGLISGMSGGGGQTTTDLVRQVLENNVGGNMSSTDLVRQVLENSVTGNVTTEDLVKQVLEGTGPGNVSTSDYIKQVLTGNTPGNITTEDIIHPTVDDSDISALGEKDGKTYGAGFSDSTKASMGDAVDDAIKDSDVGDKGTSDGKTYGSSFASALKNTLSGALAGGSGKGGGSFIGGLLTGAASGGGEGGGGGGGPLEAVSGALNSGGVAGGALPGIGGVSGMAATITGLAAALVAVLPGIVSVVGGLGAIGGAFAILETTNAKFAADMKSDLSGIEGVAAQAAAGLAKPLEGAVAEVVGYVKSIEPDLKEVFSASVPLIQPLVQGIENLINAVGPGFLAMIKAGAPVMQQFAGGLGDLGHDLGSMFSDFAAAGGSAGVATRAILDLLGDLLPLVGKLGEVMAQTMAPAFASFTVAIGSVFKAFTPLLTIVGQFAGAVLSDLSSVLGALGTLLVDLAPSFTLLAKVASDLFNTLENTGVFAIMGDALENLAGPLANLINGLVKGIAPALPPLITLIGQLSGVIVNLMTAGLDVFITAAAKLVQFISPILPAILDVVVAVKAWTIAQGLLNTVMDMNPFVAITAAVILVAGIIVTYHKQIYDTIVDTWNAIESFLEGLWNGIVNFAKSNWLELLLGPAGLIVKYHQQVEQSIESIWNAIFGFLKGIWNSIEGSASSTWNSIKSTAVSVWDSIWSSVESVVSSGVKNVENWIAGLPGDITGVFKGAGTLLTAIGGDIITGLGRGAQAVWNSVVSFFANIPKDILNALGIHSPPDWAIQAGKDIMNGLGIGIGQAQAAVSAATLKAASQAAAAAAMGGAPSGSSGGSIEALMQQMAAARGWTGAEWTALYDVEMREAGFNLTAQNPTSGAYGLAQFINGPSEYAQYGGNSSTAAGQITAMLNYIAQRYGTPEAAWQHELNYGWYDHGGWLKPGYTLAYNGTGAPERVGGDGTALVQLEISGGQSDFEKFMSTWVKNYVRIKGGGNVQSAFGRN